MVKEFEMKTAFISLVIISMVAFSFDDIYIKAPDNTDLELTTEGSSARFDFASPFGDDGNPDCGPVWDEPTDPPLFIATALNTWQIDGGYASKALGLEFVSIGGNYCIAFIDGQLTKDTLFFADHANLGTRHYGSGLHASNSSPFGTAITPPNMTNTDFSSSNLFRGLWTTWNSYSNPAGDDSRGITKTADGYLWLTRTTGSSGSYVQSLGRMENENPGSIVWYDASYGLSGTRKLSGLTDFQYFTGNAVLAYTIYNSGWVRFQEYTGSGINYLGYASLPVSSVDGSYGICYDSIRDSFYWSYKKGSHYYVTEMSINITALSRSTWGQIKTSF